MSGEANEMLRQLAMLLLYAGGGAWAALLYQRNRQPRGRIARPPATSAAPARDGELSGRLRAAEENLRQLRRSLLSIPEIAQRLFAAESERQVPRIALDLVEELFAPSYAFFYAAKGEGFVAVESCGVCELPIGHRVESGQGVVGWTALRQIAFTSADADGERRAVRERDLAVAMPAEGFSLCLPIVTGEVTAGVILIGPSVHAPENPKELGRTIALMTSAALANVRVISREKYLAKTDGLTGLLNKRSILEFLRARLEADRNGPISVFLFDIDHFKHYNDTNGHLTGDELLRGMGNLIREHCRDSEGLGRYGGEEFVLVMDGAPKAQALAAAERLRMLVEQQPFAARESQPGGKLTISGGVATWPGDAPDMDALLRAADEALYEAKRSGRNQVLAYHLPELELSDVEDWDAKSD
jgi:diguanylate cyclase (GGDEF)-like protein